MHTTRALAIVAITLLSAACTQQDLSSESPVPTAAAPLGDASPSDSVASPNLPPVGSAAAADEGSTSAAASTPPTPRATVAPATPAEAVAEVPQVDQPAGTMPTADAPPTTTDSTEPPGDGAIVVPALPAEAADVLIDVSQRLPTPTVGDLAVAPPIAPCGPQQPMPADALAIESMLLDVDHDGAADTVTSYHSNEWRLRLELANGPTDDVAITGVGGVGMARILSDAQVDWDITDPTTWAAELIVQAGANASGVNVTVFGIDDDGCLFRFSDEDDDDIVLPIHASIGAMSGLLCDHIAGAGFLVQLSALHDVGATYDASSTQLVRVGTALVPGTSLNHTIDSETQAGWLMQFGGLTCDSVVLP